MDMATKFNKNDSVLKTASNYARAGISKAINSINNGQTFSIHIYLESIKMTVMKEIALQIYADFLKK